MSRVSRDTRKKSTYFPHFNKKTNMQTHFIWSGISAKEKGYNVSIFGGHHQKECCFHLSYLMFSGALLEQMYNLLYNMVNNDEQMPVQSSFISTIHLFANSKNKKIVEPSLKRNSYVHTHTKCELLLSFYGRI